MNNTYAHVCLDHSCSCDQIIQACRAANESFCECYNMAPMSAKELFISAGIVVGISIVLAILYNRIRRKP